MNNVRVGIIDCDMGNLLSVRHGIESVGGSAFICEGPDSLEDADRLVLPGVGAFLSCMQELEQRGVVPALEKAVFQDRKPILGICLGMQAMATTGREGGAHAGLKWFDADVIRIVPFSVDQKVPHIGWNNVTFSKEESLFEGIPWGAEFYFLHSYWMQCRQPSDVVGTFEYFGQYTAVVRKANIVATQFHPEKSQSHGLQFLRNFLQWEP